ncbi:MAG: PLP-dependent aminotransferase family protein [Acidobacteria bacterium]|nr:PLP-dependent aminotransferase family protein [Acidobacteriota bacterium]
MPPSSQDEPLFRQLYYRFRNAILDGTFSPGQKLPSTREIAEEIGVSRTVALMAYEQLLAEGFANGRIGSGTYVSSAVQVRSARSLQHFPRITLSRFGRAARNAGRRIQLPSQAPRHQAYDFALGTSDVEIFPFHAWARMLQRRAHRIRVAQLDYASPGGNLRLRQAICSHLRRSRAVVCDPDQVIIVNGSQQAIDLSSRVLIESGDTVAIEDPSYQGTREVLRAAGADLFPMPVDSDGLDPSKLPSAARLVFVTPSHQFPTGAILPLARRLALLDWARRNKALIVEDDYDGEFYYQGQPIESLQGLDAHGRVIYIGTFSRSIFSALRIGYLVAPKALVGTFIAAKWLSDRHTANLEQETLAEFIGSGLYERYLRRLRRRNARRRDALLEAIREFLRDRVQISGAGAGAHIVVWPGRGISEKQVVRRALTLGILIYGVGPYYVRKPLRPGLLLGYSRLNETEIREGIRRLSEVL